LDKPPPQKYTLETVYDLLNPYISSTPLRTHRDNLLY